ncbi:hypothetical protein DFJ43DRAFT_1202852 [Lentinula guzmanii]|uniref:Uncharacterized protein n=1 Tax=Lentinula guzmanii TaxID=2804957 RepID=A0AA38J5U5_9AGAR|nr:hypothetical protein DFJ43DRAFT_1202852 [Lentinula guzmanii]
MSQPNVDDNSSDNHGVQYLEHSAGIYSAIEVQQPRPGQYIVFLTTSFAHKKRSQSKAEAPVNLVLGDDVDPVETELDCAIRADRERSVEEVEKAGDSADVDMVLVPPPRLPPPTLQELGLSFSVITADLSPSHFSTPPSSGAFLSPHYLLLCHAQGLDIHFLRSERWPPI